MWFLFLLNAPLKAIVKFQTQSFNTFWDRNYYVLWISESVIGIFPRSTYIGFMLWRSFKFALWYFLRYRIIIQSETDRKWCIWAHRAICTGGFKGGLKNQDKKNCLIYRPTDWTKLPLVKAVLCHFIWSDLCPISPGDAICISCI